MAIITTDSKNYTDIAAAIRSKNGLETQYKPSEMAAAISAIVAGGGNINMVETTFSQFSNGATEINVFDYVDNVEDILMIYFRLSTDYKDKYNSAVYIKGYGFLQTDPLDSSNTILGAVVNPIHPYEYANSLQENSYAFTINSSGILSYKWYYKNTSTSKYQWNAPSQVSTTASKMHMWMLYK